MPNTSGRYHLIQIMDAYTNVFAAPGTRTTGNNGGSFLITGPSWTGEIPEGVVEYKSPTNYVWILGRTQVNSMQDGKDFVVPLMQQYKLETLYNNTPPAKQCDLTALEGNPNEVVDAMSIEDFFNYINCLMVINPPAEADKDIMERIAKIGVAPGARFDLGEFNIEEQNAIKAVPEKAMEEIITYGYTLSREKGWVSMANAALGKYGTDYLFRAHVARFGLAANLSEDAVYLIAHTDESGEVLLDGSNKYVLHFEPGATPPVNAFWSLTLYENDYLSANSINRYALGDRDILKKNTDGSIDIYIQHTNPGSDKESNWLPCPAGIFDLTLRAYYPKPELSSGLWKMPGVKIVQ